MTQPPSDPSYKLRRPGGEVDTKRVFNAPGIVVGIAIVTTLFFIAMVLAPERAVRIIEMSAGVSPQRFLQGAAANGGALNMVSPLIAHMFVHAGLLHLGLNMVWLLAFGAPVARRMGADRALQSSAAFASASMFLTLYLLSGIVGALTYIVLHANEWSILVGASGGVSGLLGALVRFAFNRSTLFGPERAKLSSLLSQPVITWSAVIVLMNVAIGVFGGALAGGANIAWEAHLGGYFFGLLTYPFFERAAQGFR